MKQWIAAMMIFFFVATVAQAQTATTTNNSKQTEKTDAKVAKTKCCDHDFVDANKDGKCDICGMAMQKNNAKCTKDASTKGGCSGTENKGKSCSKSCGGPDNTAGCKSKNGSKPCCGK
jgi:hypothetical protein